MEKKTLTFALAMLFAFCLLPVMSLADWGWLYQENATSYACAGTWVGGLYPCNNTYDANWTTYGYSWDGIVATVYMNYTQHVNATSTSLWQVGDAGTGVFPDNVLNLSIPESCWNQSPLQFKAESYWKTSEVTDFIKWYCLNETEWDLLRANTGNNEFRIHEEGIFWNITDLPPTTTTTTTTVTTSVPPPEENQTYQICENDYTLKITTARELCDNDGCEMLTVSEYMHCEHGCAESQCRQSPIGQLVIVILFIVVIGIIIGWFLT